MATLDMLRPGLLTDVNAETNKAVDTGVKLATMQDQIQQQKQQVEKQKLDIEAAKFNQALSTMKTFSSMDPKVQGMSAKYLGQKLADYGFANGPMLLDTLKSDDTSKFMMNNIASASPEELSAIGIDPQSGVQGIMAMTDPMAFRTSIQDINDRLIKYREGSRTERIADKRLLAAEDRADRRAIEAAGKEEKKEVKANKKAAVDLRKEFDKIPEVKAYKALSTKINSIDEAISNPSTAKDLGLIYTLMTSLDPNTGVKEGEFATAKNAGSIPDTILGTYNKALKGTLMSDSLRKDYVNQVKSLVGNYEKTALDQAAYYTELAEQAGLDSEQVVGSIKKRGEKKKSSFTPPPNWTPEMISKYKASRGL